VLEIGYVGIRGTHLRVTRQLDPVPVYPLLRDQPAEALRQFRLGAPNISPTSSDVGAITPTSQLPRIIEFSLRVQF
jgi:hypothetical protein